MVDGVGPGADCLLLQMVRTGRAELVLLDPGARRPDPSADQAQARQFDWMANGGWRRVARARGRGPAAGSASPRLGAWPGTRVS